MLIVQDILQIYAYISFKKTLIQRSQFFVTFVEIAIIKILFFHIKFIQYEILFSDIINPFVSHQSTHHLSNTNQCYTFYKFHVKKKHDPQRMIVSTRKNLLLHIVIIKVRFNDADVFVFVSLIDILLVYKIILRPIKKYDSKSSLTPNDRKNVYWYSDDFFERPN